MDLNERLKEVIKRMDLKQTEIADATKVTKQNISNIINSKSNPSVDWLSKLLLNYPAINARWLLTGIGGMFAFEENQNKNKDTNMTFECQNCKNLHDIIDKQNSLLEHYEKRLSQAV